MILFALTASIAPVAAQETAAGRVTAEAAGYRAPRTPDGQPDLQGYWTNSTYTPLQRPPDITREFFTREEALEIMKKAAAAESEQTVPGTVADVHYDFTQFGLDRNQGGVPLNLRTSLVFDPPDGRLPPLTAEGKRRAAERAETRRRMGAVTDAAQNQSLSVRCILMDRAGPPMLPGAYNNYYQIIQTQGYVMILVEMIHEPRIIPLDLRAHLPEHVRQLTGNSIGRWDGDTLVVETTNFTDRTAFQGASEQMRLVERFTRVAGDRILYQFTIDDPTTWARPWSGELPMMKTTGPIFEHACHEGNYSLYNTLAGARADEKRAAEAVRKSSQ
ncbi:MAG: hypothetical protein A3I61_14925 [Acidobacteria bacterium RIFCSPLOWO2_02_FULL_68_18]|nr:MAG: hypothetical protein A3I61_14925 [Acidobacteria bacterium RIFCSPLOWO2_02_FULL_68_18]OFW50374.1 MAG: hypothetical protein A3G77_07900 [Acidobacteria bacterium RIFCSPLOWO2_12_FULL_68_19]